MSARPKPPYPTAILPNVGTRAGTSFFGFEPIESEACGGVFYTQQDVTVELCEPSSVDRMTGEDPVRLNQELLSLPVASLDGVPCNATIAVFRHRHLSSLSRRHLRQVRRGQHSALGIVVRGLGGYLSPQKTSLNGESDA